MADVKITGLHKRYAGGVHAVRGIDLDIPDEQFTVLVGPSGCGKSTLLRTIAGLEDAQRRHDRDRRRGRQRHAPARPRRRHGVPGLRALSAHDGAQEYRLRSEGAEIPAGRRSTRASTARRRCSASRRCSTGCRASFPAASASASPSAAPSSATRKLFLFDEPLSNLDAQLRDEMRGEIKRLHQEIGTTMIYVTHDQIEAMTLADQIVLMRDGVIEQQGAPLDLFERPATPLRRRLPRLAADELPARQGKDRRRHVGHRARRRRARGAVAARAARRGVGRPGGHSRPEGRAHHAFRRRGAAAGRASLRRGRFCSCSRPARAATRRSAWGAAQWWPSSRPTTSAARASAFRSTSISAAPRSSTRRRSARSRRRRLPPRVDRVELAGADVEWRSADGSGLKAGGGPDGAAERSCVSPATYGLVLSNQRLGLSHMTDEKNHTPASKGSDTGARKQDEGSARYSYVKPDLKPGPLLRDVTAITKGSTTPP